MNLFEETRKIRNMMSLLEQDSDETALDEFNSGNFDNLKEYLSTNSELTDKLQPILKTSNLENTFQFLLKPNKTNLIRGMADAKIQKDMELYKFLEIFLKNSEPIS
jgi:hypothetical protein